MGLIDFLPLVKVSINGAPVKGRLFSQISSVRVTDVAGFVSDTAEIEFDNVSPFSRIAMPEPGAEVEIAMGYLGTFRKMGLFVADTVEERSPPRSISIVCKAKAQGETASGFSPIQKQKTRSWPAGLTVGAIVSKIADDNGLKPGVTASVAGIVPGHIDQIDESDISIITRIALAHDLTAKPAGGTLFVGKRTEGINASGQPTPSISLRESDVTIWSMTRSFGDVAGTVIATYRDLETATNKEIKVGDGEPVRRLRQRYRNEAEAKAAAQAEGRRGGRGKEALSIEMPGNPNLVAEGKISPIGFSSAASGLWSVESASHEISQDGYRTLLQANRPS